MHRSLRHRHSKLACGLRSLRARAEPKQEIVREMSKEPVQTDKLEIGQAIGQATDPGRLAIIIVGTVGVGLLIGEGTVLAARGVPDIEVVVHTLLMVSGIGLIF